MEGEPGSRSLDPSIFIAIVEDGPTSVVITDPEGSIEYVNRQFTTVTGYSRTEVIGRNPRILKSGVQAPEVYADLWRTILEGREWRGELCNRRKSGELYWELAAISAIRDASGTVTHFLALKEDITDLKTMEQLLWQAKANAEAANRAKSRFLADMSHEIRTPLNSILGFAQLLEMQASGALTGKQKEYVHWIREGGEHLMDMVNDVLDLSKVEAGRVELEKASVDVAALISRVITITRSLTAKKHLHLETAVGPEVGVISADEVRLKQVLYNLLSNAIKFTPDGKRIGVEAARDEENVAITVWDEGVGIPPAIQARIFEPYAQAPKSGEGTGLGLAIVRRLVELHGGSVLLESSPGSGSRFTVRIPAGVQELPSAGPADTAKPSRPQQPVSIRPTRSFRGKTALVVDDNRANRILMERVLTTLGCGVVFAESGEQALEVARQSPCDIVFMDVRLPGMSGGEAMHELRRSGVKVPIVAVTAHAMKGDGEKFLSEGFSAYIPKPVYIARILEALEKL